MTEGARPGPQATAARRVLVVRGGWEGHHPVETTDLFVPFLRRHGFAVRIETDPAVYADEAVLAGVDLILQCVSMAAIDATSVAGLRRAVATGVGLAGWHGGIVDSFRDQPDYLQLVGGQFVAHPAAASTATSDPARHTRSHTVRPTAAGRAHPILAGIEPFTLRTEQYWVLHDGLDDVLATTTHPVEADSPWHRPVDSPAVWVRRWGEGRVFVATPGHDLEVLSHPSVLTIIERGLMWAARTE